MNSVANWEELSQPSSSLLVQHHLQNNVDDLSRRFDCSQKNLFLPNSFRRACGLILYPAVQVTANAQSWSFRFLEIDVEGPGPFQVVWPCDSPQQHGILFHDCRGHSNSRQVCRLHFLVPIFIPRKKLRRKDLILTELKTRFRNLHLRFYSLFRAFVQCYHTVFARVKPWSSDILHLHNWDCSKGSTSLNHVNFSQGYSFCKMIQGINLDKPFVCFQILVHGVYREHPQVESHWGMNLSPSHIWPTSITSLLNLTSLIARLPLLATLTAKAHG